MATTDADMFARAMATIRSFVPQFNVIAKSKSSLHWLIGKILFFTPYMERFWTTIGYTSAYPPGDPYDWDTVYHEGRHSIQSKRLTRVWMGFLYLLPISLLPIAIAVVVTSAIMFGWSVPLYLSLGLTVITVLPLPSYWKMRFELDAYTVSIAINYWTTNVATHHRYVPAFTSADYYFMWPFKANMMQRLERAMSDIVSGRVLTDLYFRAVYLDLQQAGKLHKAHQSLIVIPQSFPSAFA